ncbi:protein FAR1-RELATED SEQUENCE 7-like [Rutidosis leptorrhynchoides]|uniref:protein FAR1-RELATED SEQUENCE 7-like n=1 Tax=Rutidosis leptorrhynchoides TaxID=125765 RepID=UPI003A992C2E
MSTATDDTVSEYSVEDNVSGDEGREEQVEPQLEPTPVSRFGFVNEGEDSNSFSYDDDQEASWVFYDKGIGIISKGMVFQNKSELIYAVQKWNIHHNREIVVTQSKPGYWQAHCRTTSSSFKGLQERYHCAWSVSENNNRCLTSSLIATEIEHQICVNFAYPVANIQAQIKNTWHVDIRYGKAWNARRIAIERLFGTWESNFIHLPNYVNELVTTNPDTIVVFENRPEIYEGFDTFKFVFWAFGPAIKAFKLCIPIIYIDGTHLKGSYKGKLLTAVAKNSNNQILPIAFALVDEESNESWSWFLQMLQENVIGNEKLCVISDRHQGILHTMGAQTYGWEHRYCLRHIRSNLLSKYTKVKSLKHLCWTVGSTTNQILYKNALRAIKQASVEAWQYLQDADVGKWTVYRDSQRSRWGNTATNIAESLNNVFRHARMIPIKACIEYTFDYTRQHFYNQSREARLCNSPLSKFMFNVFNERAKRAQRYKTTYYHEEQGIYKVHSTYQRSGEGGTDYTVEFKKKRCSCGIWQHQTLPCSHAISVCSHLNEDINKQISKKYTTPTWREQYSDHFNPLRDASYWTHIE